MARANSNKNHKHRKHSKHSRHHRGNQTQRNIQVIVGRLLLFGVPVIVLMNFVVILNLPRSGKQPRGSDDDVLLHLQLAHQGVIDENWNQTLAHIEAAEKAWAMVIPRIQIGAQRGDILDLTLGLARLKASAQCADKPGCLRELAELFVYWDEIGK